jgi:hypothetical protein
VGHNPSAATFIMAFQIRHRFLNGNNNSSRHDASSRNESGHGTRMLCKGRLPILFLLLTVGCTVWYQDSRFLTVESHHNVVVVPPIAPAQPNDERESTNTALPTTVVLYESNNHQAATVVSRYDKHPRTSLQASYDDDQEDADPCLGKERLIGILTSANITVKTDLCYRLPTWQAVSNLYGDNPIVVGLETCSTYQRIIKEAGVSAMPRVGGLYNTGTNALAWSFLENIQKIGEKDLIGQLHPYELPWGKHTPAPYRLNITFPRDNAEYPHHVLPILLVRDPYRWMQAMCKNPYFVKWQRGAGQCPNLVTMSNDRSSTQTPVPVTLAPPPMKGQQEVYTSLADLWSVWNRQYLEADYPRLMVRFEDYLFHTKKVIDEVMRCAGMNQLSPEGEDDGDRHHQFQYHVDPAKGHGRSNTDFVSAMAKYGRDRGRFRSLSKADLDYSRLALDLKLMEMFHYHFPLEEGNVGRDYGRN